MNLEEALEKIAKLEEEINRYKEIEKRYIEMTGWVIPCGQELDRSSFPDLKETVYQSQKKPFNEIGYDHHPINKPAPIILPDWDGTGRTNMKKDD